MTRLVPAALAALALALPAAARAQGCVGAPLAEGSRAFQLQGSSSVYSSAPEVDGMGIGASFRHNLRGLLAYSAEYTRASVGDNDLPLQSGGVMLALRAPITRYGVSLCARGGAMASRLSDDPSASELDNLTFPVGIVLELPVELREGRALVPYVAPQYLFSRTRGEVLGLDYERSGDAPGLEAGLGLRMGRAALTLGGSFTGLPDDLVTAAVPGQSFFLRVGVVF
jgi:hypothetical protein